MRNFCVGIASGHRETRYASCRIVDNFLSDLREHVGKSLSLHSVSMEERKGRLKQGIGEVATDSDLRDAFACLSMPGISHPKHLSDAKDLLTAIPALAEANLVLDDTITGLIAGIGNLKGICAFSGSGSSVFNGNDLVLPPEIAPRPNKIDGYGPLLGDRGSGFKISVELLSKSLNLWDIDASRLNSFKAQTDSEQFLDQRNELYDWLVEEDSQLEDVLATQVWFDTLIANSVPTEKPKTNAYTSTRDSELSELPWAVRLAHLNRHAIQQVDIALANEILSRISIESPFSALSIASAAISRAAIEMANSTRIALTGLPDDAALPIVCQGGVFQNSQFYFDEYRRAMTGYMGPIFRSAFLPVVGALSASVAQDEGLSQGVSPHSQVVEFLIANKSSNIVLKHLDENGYNGREHEST
jgi:N-acetylglucosamine kinase-like BadF-type ATPase